jgi:hypothetical protein
VRLTKHLLGLLAVCLSSSLTCGQDRQPVSGKLPVKRVVLFKNGVGYFEHVGTVHGNESVTIGFTSGQLNDVLKSLTVLDLNGGRIAGVAYGTATPLDRQLVDLRLPLGEKTTLADFLGALRGTRLEVRSGPVIVTGRLLSIERKTRISGGTTLEVDYLSLISDTGELRTTEISPSFSVKLLEPGLPRRVDRFLDVMSAAREADMRQMVIATAGAGDRSIYVSYISEVPVWKSTYRIVLSSKPDKNPLLQGWAIIDNIVGEDWNNVELSLVAGAPQSFIQNLSKPYYSQRPTLPLPDNVSTVPQTHEATLIPGGAQLTGVITDPSGGSIPRATVKAFDATGALIAQAVANESGAARKQDLIDAARAGVEAAARSEGLGDLFEYKLKDAITILKNRSALAPIVQSPIAVEKVSIWNDKTSLQRPQRALWITNSTGLTLDGGSVSTLEDDTFAGEGIFDPIRSGEKRLFSYATDLAVNATSRIGTEQERVSRSRNDDSEERDREKKTYTFRNEDSAPRTIIVEHPVRAGYELRGYARPAETTADWMRFRLQVEPKQTASQ